MSETLPDEPPLEGKVPLPRLLVSALKLVIAVDVFAMMTLIFVDVFMRYLFNAPLPGSFEIAQFMLALMIFCALPIVTWTEGNISVALFEGWLQRISRKGQRMFVMVMNIAGLALLGVLIWRQAFSLQQSRQATGFLDLPIYPLAFLMLALTVVALAIQMAIAWHEIRAPGATTNDKGGARQ